MGICTSTGVIRDFAGPYFVSVSRRQVWILKQNLLGLLYTFLVTFEPSPLFCSSKLCQVAVLDGPEEHDVGCYSVGWSFGGCDR